jgi:hypothetical protein
LLDRTISGAGALTDLADRAVRPLGRRRGANPLATRPGSVIVAVILVLLAMLLLLAGLEVTDDPSPRVLAAGAITTDAGLPERLYATVTGSVSPDYVESFFDLNGNGELDGDEVTAEWYYFLVDPDTLTGVTVRSTRPPEEVLGDDDDFDLVPATFTGMLRRDERAVSDAKSSSALRIDDRDLTVSDRDLLDDGATPANPYLAYGLAGLAGVLAGAILVGLAGGYLIYRRSAGRLPEPATSMAVGERLPLRVTGLLRTTEGLLHVREAPADLVRFPVAASAPPPGEPPDPDPADTDPADTDPADTDPADTDPPAPEVPSAVAEPPSTLIIERQGRPEGVALGLGQLVRLTSGVAIPFRGARPALRAVAGTGPLVLSFDGEGDRDRAAAELLDETGLGSSVAANEPTEG